MHPQGGEQISPFSGTEAASVHTTTPPGPQCRFKALDGNTTLEGMLSPRTERREDTKPDSGPPVCPCPKSVEWLVWARPYPRRPGVQRSLASRHGTRSFVLGPAAPTLPC